MHAEKLVLVTFLFLLGLSHSKAQKLARNHVFIEVGGAAGLASINYERFVYEEQFSLRFGYGLASKGYAALHGSVNYYLKTKSKNRFWQLGLGTTFSNTNLQNVTGNREFEPNYVYIVPIVGHKWRSARDCTFQLNFSPFVREDQVLPWGGITIGKQF
jgi:hypothetical protein